MYVLDCHLMKTALIWYDLGECLFTLAGCNTLIVLGTFRILTGLRRGMNRFESQLDYELKALEQTVARHMLSHSANGRERWFIGHRMLLILLSI